MNTVILENDLEYIIMDTVELDGNIYTLLSNVHNAMDYCFRKTIIKDGENYFSGLSDRNEFEKVLIAFTEKLNG